MNRVLTSLFLAAALLATTTGAVFAQEPTDDITGTVQSVEIQTDSTTGETIVLVTLTDGTVAHLSFETAESLEFVTADPITGEPAPAEGIVGSEATIPADAVLPGEEEQEQEDEHPVGSTLSNFFGGLFGVEYDSIMEYHEGGVGFGVIAQALWLTNQLDGDTITFEALLEAKKSGDFSNITLADGSTPNNWGDVVKSLKKGDNLGSVMSGRAEAEEDSQTAIQSNGNGHGNNGSNGNGNGKGKDKGKENGKGKGNNK